MGLCLINVHYPWCPELLGTPNHPCIRRVPPVTLAENGAVADYIL
jgi:hypothetical protein